MSSDGHFCGIMGIVLATLTTRVTACTRLFYSKCKQLRYASCHATRNRSRQNCSTSAEAKTFQGALQVSFDARLLIYKLLKLCASNKKQAANKACCELPSTAPALSKWSNVALIAFLRNLHKEGFCDSTAQR